MGKISSIRKANVSDAYDIAYINAISWQKAYRGILPDEILDSISVDIWSSGWERQLKNNAFVLVVCLNDNTVGFVQICMNIPANVLSLQGEITAIYLHPDVWGKGFGKKLCLASLTELKNFGAKEASIWALAENTRARQFYKSLGFNESGCTRIFKMHPNVSLDEIQYVKGL